MKKGKLLVISGPSAGVGKDTIMRLFLDRHPDWYQPTSTTTRPLRPEEKQGKDMNSVSEETFRKWQEEGKFLESDFHADHWYGTLKKPVEDLILGGKNVVLRTDVNGARQIKQRIPEAIIVFIAAESRGILESRIRARRTETEEQIQNRLKLAQRELKHKKHFDYVIINPHNQHEEAVKAVEKAAGL